MKITPYKEDGQLELFKEYDDLVRSACSVRSKIETEVKNLLKPTSIFAGVIHFCFIECLSDFRFFNCGGLPLWDYLNSQFNPVKIIHFETFDGILEIKIDSDDNDGYLRGCQISIELLKKTEEDIRSEVFSNIEEKYQKFKTACAEYDRFYKEVYLVERKKLNDAASKHISKIVNL